MAMQEKTICARVKILYGRLSLKDSSLKNVVINFGPNKPKAKVLNHLQDEA